MTANEFRALALELPEAEEKSHMGHPDFRIANKIFATLGSPDDKSGMVKLTPEQQKSFMRDEPKVFKPASGAWGKGGATIVALEQADETTIRQALVLAWRNTAPKRLVLGMDQA